MFEEGSKASQADTKDVVAARLRDTAVFGCGLLCDMRQAVAADRYARPRPRKADKVASERKIGIFSLYGFFFLLTEMASGDSPFPAILVLFACINLVSAVASAVPFRNRLRSFSLRYPQLPRLLRPALRQPRNLDGRHQPHRHGRSWISAALFRR